MDSKRLDQHRAVNLTGKLSLLAGIVFVALTFASCTWAKDDYDDCQYGFWLRLSYTYNIMDVEAAPEYLGDAHVYVYDAAGNFVKRIDASASQLKTDGQRVRVEGLPEGDYQFMVWSGSSAADYSVSGDGGERDGFRLSLSSAGTLHSSQRLQALYYGALSTVRYSDTGYTEHVVSMMKDTNELSCLAVSTGEESLTADNCSLRLVAANAIMDGTNALAGGAPVSYEPYQLESVTIDDPDYGTLHGVRVGISTLRLVAGTSCRLLLERQPGGEVVFDVSLPEYIGMVGRLSTSLGRELSVQEYLDRQDYYTVVMLFDEGLDQLLQLRVNSWRVRAYNFIKV